MNNNRISIEIFSEKINKWTGKEIKVLKQEVNDLDETIISLEKVTYRENINRIDDYEPKFELQLTGSGQVKIGDGDFEPLPYSIYEIALDEDATFHFDGTAFTLKTDRGMYAIQLTGN